jgi:hypothetical protein
MSLMLMLSTVLGAFGFICLVLDVSAMKQSEQLKLRAVSCIVVT